MKKCFFYAGALAMLLSSCSNDEVPTGPVLGGSEQSGVVRDLKISLVSDVSTKSAVEDGVGTENNIELAYVLVKVDADGPDGTGGYEYKYVPYLLDKGSRSVTVKYAEEGSGVYVLANVPGLTKEAVDKLVEAANVSGEAAFFNEKYNINKLYISSLDSRTGSFTMSGTARVPMAVDGAGAKTLSIPISRDLAKVDFSVKKAGTGGYRVKSVENITIRRSADFIQPFARKGIDKTTYVIPFGYGHKDYVQDGLKAGVFSPENDKQTLSPKATDYSFIYDWSGDETLELYKFKSVYILPNAASSAEKGTIIVLKAVVEQETTTGTWNELGVRYFKARVSSGLDAFATDQNSAYKILASIKGEGNNDPTGPTGPDAEDTENDLNITVEVQPWKVVMSNQEME